MKKAKVLIYDGSFNGFLTAVFIAFEEKVLVTDIRKNNRVQNGLFSEVETVFTQMDKAKRVWNGIQNKNHSAIKQIYFAYLSESKGIELVLYKYIQKLFFIEDDLNTARTTDLRLKTAQLSRMVEKEKQWIETSLNFGITGDGIHFANIAPDFNILPLISKYFRYRYGDQQWIIYDMKRKYGLFYNGTFVEIISLDLRGMYADNTLNAEFHSTTVNNSREFANSYFKDNSIKSLINSKLHRQPAPQRYRKYENEKRAV